MDRGEKIAVAGAAAAALAMLWQRRAQAASSATSQHGGTSAPMRFTPLLVNLMRGTTLLDAPALRYSGLPAARVPPEVDQLLADTLDLTIEVSGRLAALDMLLLGLLSDARRVKSTGDPSDLHGTVESFGGLSMPNAVLRIMHLRNEMAVAHWHAGGEDPNQVVWNSRGGGWWRGTCTGRGSGKLDYMTYEPYGGVQWFPFDRIAAREAFDRASRDELLPYGVELPDRSCSGLDCANVPPDPTHPGMGQALVPAFPEERWINNVLGWVMRDRLGEREQRVTMDVIAQARDQRKRLRVVTDNAAAGFTQMLSGCGRLWAGYEVSRRAEEECARYRGEAAARTRQMISLAANLLPLVGDAVDAFAREIIPTQALVGLTDAVQNFQVIFSGFGRALLPVLDATAFAANLPITRGVLAVLRETPNVDPRYLVTTPQLPRASRLLMGQ